MISQNGVTVGSMETHAVIEKANKNNVFMEKTAPIRKSSIV